MLPMFVVLFTFFVISFVLLHIKIIDLKSDFSNAIVNFLLIIGVYSLYVTNFKTIFLLPVLLILVHGIFLKQIKLSFSFKSWKVSLTIISIVTFIFVLLFWRSKQLFIVHEDYLFWIRVGIMNQKLGLENINVFYNLLDANYNGIDFYHFLELWCMDFGNIINGQPHALNLFLFAYPIASIISCFGIRELFVLYFNLKTKKIFFVISSIFFIFFFLLFFAQPWDTFNNFFSINGLPISGMGPAWKNLKTLYILNIFIALMIYLKKASSNNFIILILSLFFYIPVFPIVMLTISFWFVFLNFKNIKISKYHLYIYVLLLLLFIAVYTFLGNHKGTTISGFSLNELFTISHWLKILPSIIMKSVIIPIIGFSPLLLLLIKKQKIFLHSRTLIFIILLYLVCMSVWIVFVKNIDANQSFLLLFSVIFPLVSAIITWYLLFVKKNILGLLLVFIYVLPGISNAYNYKSPLKDDDQGVKEFIANLKSNTRVLFIPNKTDLTSVFDFNERVYTGINQFVLYNSKIVLMSFPAAIEIDTTFLNTSSYTMYEYYRNNSPYFSKCGFIDFSSTCFYDFLNKKKIDVICSRFKDLPIKGWFLSREEGGYYFYIHQNKIIY